MTDPRPVRPGAKAADEVPPTNAGGDRFCRARSGSCSHTGSEAAAGAQGTAGETFVENTQARDEGLEDMGLDPQDPSGELTDPEPPATMPSVVDVPYASQQEGNALIGDDGELDWRTNLVHLRAWQRCGSVAHHRVGVECLRGDSG